jgi:hypothetical protein
MFRIFIQSLIDPIFPLSLEMSNLFISNIAVNFIGMKLKFNLF